MLPPQASPVHKLVHPWWARQDRPHPESVPALREALTQAALDELRIRKDQWCPFSDARILWGAQYLNRAEGTIFYRIDPDITARARFVFDGLLPACHKDRAAGST